MFVVFVPEERVPAYLLSLGRVIPFYLAPQPLAGEGFLGNPSEP